ncbi:MAG: hypothetical protein NVS4B13_09530 [Candidatus Elarobacter sp.]
MVFGRLAGASLLALSLVIGCGGLSAAQSPVEVHGSPPPASEADITLDADVHIRSIHYSSVPKKAGVNVTGVNQVGGYTVTRTNLPAHPQAGTTYRNVRIQLHAASRFVDPAQARRSPAPAATR